ncbi:hypothetical protein GY45DRAFT_1270739 [Cubamyces sp. BRFM 1775]|nr:hypothetical protein GY45DRAFT_1270739 [Cubamyces sp. BRFM 1775]
MLTRTRSQLSPTLLDHCCRDSIVIIAFLYHHRIACRAPCSYSYLGHDIIQVPSLSLKFPKQRCTRNIRNGSRMETPSPQVACGRRSCYRLYIPRSSSCLVFCRTPRIRPRICLTSVHVPDRCLAVIHLLCLPSFLPRCELCDGSAADEREPERARD